MGSDNKSPSYLEERERVRRFLESPGAGQYAKSTLLKHSAPGEAVKIFDDDRFTNWSDVVREHRDDVVIAANCREAREAFKTARQSSTNLTPPTPSASRMRQFFSPPIWYVLRRQVETGDPFYWNDPKNVYREALDNLEWATVDAEYLRGQLAQYLPRSTT